MSPEPLSFDRDLRIITRWQLGIIALFIVLKSSRRWIMAHTDSSVLDVFLLSFPNFAEAAAGTLVLAGIALWLRARVFRRTTPSNSFLYAAVTIAGGIYVITQEMKLHNLGGENVYDPWDVLFSVIGLAFGYGLLLRLKPNVEVVVEKPD